MQGGLLDQPELAECGRYRNFARADRRGGGDVQGNAMGDVVGRDVVADRSQSGDRHGDEFRQCDGDVGGGQCWSVEVAE